MMPEYEIQVQILKIKNYIQLKNRMILQPAKFIERAKFAIKLNYMVMTREYSVNKTQSLG